MSQHPLPFLDQTLARLADRWRPLQFLDLGLGQDDRGRRQHPDQGQTTTLQNFAMSLSTALHVPRHDCGSIYPWTP